MKQTNVFHRLVCFVQMEAQIQGRDHNFSLATRVSIYILAKRLAGKSFFEMTYLVSSGTLNFKPINQSINQSIKSK